MMPETPDPPPLDPSIPAWGKVGQYCDKLSAALRALAEAGGTPRAAGAGGWSPKAWSKALATLEAAREALDDEIERLESTMPPRRPR